MIFHMTEKSNINIDESTIVRVSWSNSGKNIIFDLDWCGQSNFEIDLDKIASSSLEFQNAADVEILMNFGNYMGPPTIYEFMISEQKDYYKIDIKFVSGPSGSIKLICKNCYFIVNEVK